VGNGGWSDSGTRGLGKTQGTKHTLSIGGGEWGGGGVNSNQGQKVASKYNMGKK